MAVGELEEARALCQAYIRRYPSSHELWHAYANVEEVGHPHSPIVILLPALNYAYTYLFFLIVQIGGNTEDAAKIVVGLVAQIPGNFQLWNHYALFNLVHLKTDAALRVLCDCVEPYVKLVRYWESTCTLCMPYEHI